MIINISVCLLFPSSSSLHAPCYVTFTISFLKFLSFDFLFYFLTRSIYSIRFWFLILFFFPSSDLFVFWSLFLLLLFPMQYFILHVQFWSTISSSFLLLAHFYGHFRKTFLSCSSRPSFDPFLDRYSFCRFLSLIFLLVRLLSLLLSSKISSDFWRLPSCSSSTAIAVCALLPYLICFGFRRCVWLSSVVLLRLLPILFFTCFAFAVYASHLFLPQISSYILFYVLTLFSHLSTLAISTNRIILSPA